ncbi:uncharacterized protein V1516DRAFT_691187 [Lipomyces oligophaga]|uniref:uncharacterized protein n=1 Tax=Lipomyces oligophaga TaxID=45792 RepID=UPI0034CD95DF
MWPFKPRALSPSSYEKALSRLDQRIKKSQVLLRKLRLSQRRFVGLATLYPVLLYFAFLTYTVIARRYHDLYYLSCCLGAPGVIFLIRRMITVIYASMIRHEEARLDYLREDQKSKIQELKNRMKYDTTKELIDRFGAATEDHTEEVFDKSPRGRSLLIEPEQSVSEQEVNRYAADDRFTFDPYEYRREHKWYDRFIDLVLGEDELSARNRYALICRSCFAHNGLAPPGSEPDEVKYICPRCGAVNPNTNLNSHSKSDERTDNPQEVGTIEDEEVQSGDENDVSFVLEPESSKKRLARRAKGKPIGTDSSMDEGISSSVKVM